MRPISQRYAPLAWRGTAAATNARTPVLVADTDFRLTRQGMAAAAFSYLRAGVKLEQVPPTDWPTAHAEYVVPDLLLLAPSAVITLSWNRVLLYQTTETAPQDGEFYVYRTTDDPPAQRVRLGRSPDAGDVIRAELYVIDFTR